MSEGQDFLLFTVMFPVSGIEQEALDEYFLSKEKSSGFRNS
jgi:hypothetical protein